ncbi:dihydrolipoamide acetyltransferase family protein [Mycoplasmopsis agassizii]|nr:dihydrolipoamide acetyltransferase family protein [Mycoplasmopsis agassizii]
MFKFKFADIGEGLHEGNVAQVYVKVGQTVAEGEPLFSVETDKMTSDIPSPKAGKIAEILLKEGQTIHVGDVIFVIDDGSSSAPVKEEAPAESAPAVVGNISVSNEIKPTTGLSFGSKKSTPAATSTNSATMPKGLSKREQLEWAKNNSGSAKPATPASSSATMPKGLSKREQLEWLKNQASAPAAAPAASPSPAPVAPTPTASAAPTSTPVAPVAGERKKVDFVRKAIAKAMKNSWANVAYVNLVHRANVSELWDYRAAIKDSLFELTGAKITFLAFIIKATTLALKEYPIFGAKFDEKTEEIVYPSAVNIGIAVDTDHGLFVPVIKDADKKNVIELAKEIVTLAKAARDKTLKPAQMSGATFTITNYGSVGSLHGVPVINYPEVGILGVGAIIDEAVVVKGEVKPGKVMYLTTAADHRWIDGSTIGRFTTRVVQLLENPRLLGAF